MRYLVHLGIGGLLLYSSMALANVSGKVFRDFNANGSFDSGSSFNEVGMAGVTAKAFDADDPPSAPTAVATSAANGNYTLTGLQTGAKYRLEFSWGESWLKPGVAGGTSVQFVTNGATGVNVAVNDPAQYCQANPEVGVTRMVRDGFSTKPVIQSFDYSSSGDDRSTLTEFAHESDNIGALWGTAYRRDTKKLYASALLRRHTSEGSLGFGGIYEIDVTNPSAGPVKWLAVSNAGSLSKARGIPDDGSPSYDSEAYPLTGKISLGDIDVSDDGKTLYAMNLNTRSLVPIDIDTKTEGTPIPVGDPGCANPDDVRPWAVGVHEGNVYVGVVCSNESVGSIDSHFKAYVRKLTGSSFTTVASMPLNYEKDWAAIGLYPTPKNNCSEEAGWFPWVTATSPTDSGMTGCRGISEPNTAIHPQPILSDIEFDVDGSIILGFLDRIALQGGEDNLPPFTEYTTLFNVYSGGDIRRICNVNGSYVAEGGTGCAFNGGQNGSKKNEFYQGDPMMFSYDGQPANLEAAHSEVSLGSLALLPGKGEVMLTVYDPIYDRNGTGSRWASNGVRWLSNTNGDLVKSFEIVRKKQAVPSGSSALYVDKADSDFGKTAGLGDLVLLCDEAPLEAGNRVWFDADGDGIQDADESGVNGVQVKLTCGTDEATVTTANGGNFLFSNASGGNAAFMAPGKSCRISIAKGQTPLNGYSLTTKDADGVTDNDPLTDLRDSDASNNAGTAEIAFAVGSAGASNHTLDFGYRTTPACHLNTPTVSAACNDNGTSTDPSDDTFNYTINATGDNTGATYSISGDDVQSGVAYGSEQGPYGSFPISNGTLNLTLADVDNATCSLSNVTVAAPATCSTQVDLRLEKSVNKASAQRGDTVVYTLTVTNDSKNPATGVKITDILPPGVTLAAAAPVAQQGTYTPATGIWALGDLGAGQAATLTITVTVN